jgi:hypothetical protein
MDKSSQNHISQAFKENQAGGDTLKSRQWIHLKRLLK